MGSVGPNFGNNAAYVQKTAAEQHQQQNDMAGADLSGKLTQFANTLSHEQRAALKGLLFSGQKQISEEQVQFGGNEYKLHEKPQQKTNKYHDVGQLSRILDKLV